MWPQSSPGKQRFSYQAEYPKPLRNYLPPGAKNKDQHSMGKVKFFTTQQSCLRIK